MNVTYWIWLQLALGYGYKNSTELLEYFHNAENIFKAKKKDFLPLSLSKTVVDKLGNKCLLEAERIKKESEENGITIIPFSSPLYPERLREIPSAPVVLYIKGNASLLNEAVSICVVGPRKVSDYGKKAAFSLSARLALCGFTIVSGGALGTDTAAHLGALSVSGKTICFLGTGINSSYLKVNEPLRDKISENGVLVTEFPIGYSASKFSFPIRNRLMAALTLGTVVIEAGDKSGALITANAANDLGKDVFVIPGNPTSPHYKGSNLLLRDGAKPLLELADIVTEYLPLFPHKIKPDKAYSQKLQVISLEKKEKPKKEEKIIKNNKKILQENLSNNAKMVYNYLDKEFFYVDDLIGLPLTNSQILAAITELEIFGYIKAMPGGKYSLVN